MNFGEELSREGLYRDLLSPWDLYGISIALLIQSLDRSLFTRLIICSKAVNGIDGARDGKQTPGVVYSDAIEISADFFNKL